MDTFFETIALARVASFTKAKEILKDWDTAKRVYEKRIDAGNADADVYSKRW